MTKLEKDELFNELLDFLSKSSVSVEDLPEAGSLDDVNSFPAYKKDSKELVTIPSSALKEASNEANAAAQSALSAALLCMLAGANANSAVLRVNLTLNSLPGLIETLVNNSTSAQSNVNSRLINFYTNRPSSNAVEKEITISEDDERTFELLMEEEFQYAYDETYRPMIFTVLLNNVPKYRKIIYEDDLTNSQNYIDYDLSGLHERVDKLQDNSPYDMGVIELPLVSQGLTTPESGLLTPSKKLFSVFDTMLNKVSKRTVLCTIVPSSAQLGSQYSNFRFLCSYSNGNLVGKAVEVKTDEILIYYLSVGVEKVNDTNIGLTINPIKQVTIRLTEGGGDSHYTELQEIKATEIVEKMIK